MLSRSRAAVAADPASVQPAVVAEITRSGGDETRVVIDGKKLRGTNPTARGTKGDYILNAFVSENHLLIGQMALQDKERLCGTEPVAYPQAGTTSCEEL